MALPTLLGSFQMYRGLSGLMSPDVDYDILQRQAAQKELEADSLELQIEQQANMLRQQFVKAVGSATYGGARRGVKVGEGNLQQDIEQSAMNVDKDIQTGRENVKFKQNILKSQARQLRSTASATADMNRLSNVGKFIEGASSMFSASKLEDMPTLTGSSSPSKTFSKPNIDMSDFQTWRNLDKKKLKSLDSYVGGKK